MLFEVVFSIFVFRQFFPFRLLYLCGALCSQFVVAFFSFSSAVCLFLNEMRKTMDVQCFIWPFLECMAEMLLRILKIFHAAQKDGSLYAYRTIPTSCG